MASARVWVPTGSPRILLLNDAANPRTTVAPGASVASGTSETAVCVLTTMNSNGPEAAFSVNVPTPSELALGDTFAVVAASPSVAFATSEDRVTHVLPILLCRLTTILPRGAPPLPVFVAVRRPETMRRPATVAP